MRTFRKRQMVIADEHHEKFVISAIGGECQQLEGLVVGDVVEVDVLMKDKQYVDKKGRVVYVQLVELFKLIK